VFPRDWLGQFVVTLFFSQIVSGFLSIPFSVAYRIVTSFIICVIFSDPLRQFIVQTIQTFLLQSLKVEVSYEVTSILIIVAVVVLILFGIFLYKKRVHTVIKIILLSFYGALSVCISVNTIYITYRHLDLPTFCCDSLSLQRDDPTVKDHLCPLHIETELWIVFSFIVIYLCHAMWQAEKYVIYKVVPTKEQIEEEEDQEEEIEEEIEQQKKKKQSKNVKKSNGSI
jgi:hypothetical protein